MLERAQRTTVTVRLLGRDTANTWRRPLIAEGIAVPTSGTCSVALGDISGCAEPDEAIAQLRALAQTEPLVVVQSMGDPMPFESYADIVVLRTGPDRAGPVVRALKSASLERTIAKAAGVRLQALASLGHSYPSTRVEGTDTPAAMLTEPHPGLLSMLGAAGWRDLVAPLTSSQTLRLLENNHAGALIIHLGSGNEHRLPILKLIRRQTELRDLPVAVLAPQWEAEQIGQWSDANADLLAWPEEISGVLTFLRGAATRFRTRRALHASLAASSIADDGQPSPIFGMRTFERVVQEHIALGDRVSYGAIELKPEAHGTEHDLDEAGVYMSMALSPLELVCRPRPNLFLVAMPYADRYFANRMMRTLQTLVEDLKFGDEPSPVLIAARHRCFEAKGQTPSEAIAQLERLLADDHQSAVTA
ncbi:MAG: hypothetical protein AAF830_15265 [Pseudomonadota bacterium]